jgi:2'-5' RNA ligase
VRVFVAVWPSPDVVAALAAIDRPVRPGIRWTTPDQWHVTLRFLGQINGEELPRVKASLVALPSDGQAKAPTAVAGPTLERLGPAVLCVPVAGLDDVAAAVMARTAGVGAPIGDRPFRGHLTIARAARGVNPRPAQPVPFSASWPVTEVTLVASTLHPAGARYEVIDRFPLGS